MIQIVLAAYVLTIAHVSAPPDLAQDAAVRAGMWKLLQKTRGGFSHLEEAAFVVRDADGKLSLVEWPSSGQPDSARWEGPYPVGAVAIVHTHPNWMPDPSTLDIASARRAALPIYVITRVQITKTAGGRGEVVVRGEWAGR